MPNRSDNGVKNRWHSTFSRHQKTPAPVPVVRGEKPRLPSIELLPMPAIGHLQWLRSGGQIPLICTSALQGGAVGTDINRIKSAGDFTTVRTCGNVERGVGIVVNNRFYFGFRSKLAFDCGESEMTMRYALWRVYPVYV
jgi:hypothetical protein